VVALVLHAFFPFDGTEFVEHPDKRRTSFHDAFPFGDGMCCLLLLCLLRHVMLFLSFVTSVVICKHRNNSFETTSSFVVPTPLPFYGSIGAPSQDFLFSPHPPIRQIRVLFFL